MMIRNFTRGVSALAVLVVCAATASAQYGDLKGRFVYDGDPPQPEQLAITKDQEFCGQHNLVDESLVIGEDKGLANVVIYLRDKISEDQIHPDYAETADDRVEFDNEHCRFEPHILPVRLTQTLVLHNSDPVGHNSNLQPLGDRGINPLIAPQGEVEHKFFRAQTIPVPVSCNIHPWMRGYVLPRDNPYVAVTGKDGTFEIKNLPVGEYEFQVWHERAGYLEANGWERGRVTVTIKEGENTLGDGDIKVTPAHLEN